MLTRRSSFLQNLRRSLSMLLVSIAGLLLLSGCGLPLVVVVTATPTDMPTVSQPPTAEPAPATPAPPTPAPPTSAPVMPVDPGTVERIEFAQGETSVQLTRQVAAGQSNEYVLAALKGQIMHVSITSANSAVLPNVSSADGVELKPYTNGSPTWSGVLHADQDYFVRAVSVGQEAAYTLDIRIDPLAGPTVTDTPEPVVTIAPPTPAPNTSPERVLFGAGEIMATFSDSLPVNSAKSYVLNARAGQIMIITVDTDAGPLDRRLITPSGLMYADEVFPTAFFDRGIRLQLDESGDYLVTLSSFANPANYDITFTVVDPTNDAPDGEPERIVFASGATSASTGGYLASGGIKSYVLQAGAGQNMQVRVTAMAAGIPFTVQSPSGAIWNSQPLGSEVYIGQADIQLPETGDYVVQLSTAFASAPTRFDIVFEVTGDTSTTPNPEPERVTFAPGSIGTSIDGTLPANATKRYLLGAGAGQLVSLSASQPVSDSADGLKC